VLLKVARGTLVPAYELLSAGSARKDPNALPKRQRRAKNQHGFDSAVAPGGHIASAGSPNTTMADPKFAAPTFIRTASAESSTSVKPLWVRKANSSYTDGEESSRNPACESIEELGARLIANHQVTIYTIQSSLAPTSKVASSIDASMRAALEGQLEACQQAIGYAQKHLMPAVSPRDRLATALEAVDLGTLVQIVAETNDGNGALPEPMQGDEAIDLTGKKHKRKGCAVFQRPPYPLLSLACLA